MLNKKIIGISRKYEKNFKILNVEATKLSLNLLFAILLSHEILFGNYNKATVGRYNRVCN